MTGAGKIQREPGTSASKEGLKKSWGHIEMTQANLMEFQNLG